MVAKCDQTLGGFGYSASQITFGDSIATLTPPTGALTSLAFSAVPTTVCDVDSGSGALTISAVGTGTITATAPDNANYNRAGAVFELVVNEIGTLPLSLAAVAGDNAINITEKAAGFVISGETGAVAGAAVSVTVGLTDADGDFDRGQPGGLVGKRAG